MNISDAPIIVNYRSLDTFYQKFILFTVGRNINEYHYFIYVILKYFKEQTQDKMA